jgi:hypothetical protein
VDGVVFTISNPALLGADVDTAATTAGSVSVEVPLGTYTVTVKTTPAGYAEADPDAATVVVDEDDENADPEVFTGVGSISGTVLTDVDGDTAAALTSGVTVTLSGNGQNRSTTTNGSGAFSFADVPALDDFTLTYGLDGYKTQSNPDVDVVVDDDTAAGAVTLKKLSTLTVSVVDSSGNPLNVSTIGLFAADDTTPVNDVFGGSTADGPGSTFTFTDLDPGTTVFVYATKSGYLQVADASVALEPGDNVGSEGLTLTLLETATIDVTVSGLTDGDIDVIFDWTTPRDVDPDHVENFTADDTVSVTVPATEAITVTVDDDNSDNDCDIDVTSSFDTGDSVAEDDTDTLLITCV